MKKWLKRGAAMVIAAVMTAQAALPALAAESGTEETLKIASLSDTHYLSPTLIKDTEDIRRILPPILTVTAKCSRKAMRL